jgi:hypothetical protein
LRFDVVELLDEDDELPSRPLLLLELSPLVIGLTAMSGTPDISADGYLTIRPRRSPPS